MAKAKSSAPDNFPPLRAPTEERLPWPTHPKDIVLRPRVFRIHRLDAHAWQAYVIEGNQEHMIGKPDVFEILARRVITVMKAEGQVEFMAKKVRQ